MIIREIDLFRGFDYEVMSRISAICSEESYAKGIVLFLNGDRAEHLYILIEGTVYLEVKNGGTITYSLNAPGEIFGWSSMFEFGRYTASGICATKLKVVKINRERINKIFNMYPDVGMKFLRRLGNVFSKRLSNAYNDILSARSMVPGPSVWIDDNTMPDTAEEMLSETRDSWRDY